MSSITTSNGKPGMKILVGLCGYRPVEKLTHWAISQLATCPNPQFHEIALKPIAGPDVFRSILATEFIPTDYNAILFLDDDIVFNPQDAVKLAFHVEQGLDLVGGAYVTKSEKPQLTCRLFENQSVEFNAGAEPVKIKYLAGGFFMASRRVVEAVAQALPKCNSREAMSFFPMFQPIVKKHRVGVFHSEHEYLTEDFAFCERAKEAGFDSWLDPSIRLQHFGQKPYSLESIYDVASPQMENLVVTKC